jgi:hypothetical protein
MRMGTDPTIILTRIPRRITPMMTQPIRTITKPKQRVSIDHCTEPKLGMQEKGGIPDLLKFKKMDLFRMRMRKGGPSCQ